MLDLKHFIDKENTNSDSIEKIFYDYNINISNNRFILDGDLEELFSDSDIEIGKVVNKGKQWSYDEEGEVIDCLEGDYLETIELIQNGVTYHCQVFAEWGGCCLDYALALRNISAVCSKAKKKNKRKQIMNVA